MACERSSSHQSRFRPTIIIVCSSTCTAVRHVFGPGESGLPEAVMMAGLGGFRVISVDYRMPPEAHFRRHSTMMAPPCTDMHRTTDPKRVAYSANRPAEPDTCNRAPREERHFLFQPGSHPGLRCQTSPEWAIRSIPTNSSTTSWSRDGICQAAAHYYAAGHDMRDPLISPVYGDMAGFPPRYLPAGPATCCSAIRYGCTENGRLVYRRLLIFLRASRMHTICST